ncbi:MAG: flavin reductase family protein [Oligoflexia bacterium]|nr:flavin reductase family protein [Oligoflexia bacterium]
MEDSKSQKIKKIPLKHAYKLLGHGPTVLISSRDGVTDNLCSVSWIMPFDFDPPLIGAVIERTHKTFDNICKNKECIINIPVIDQLDIVKKMGTISGHKKDKTKGLSLQTGYHVSCKRLEGCCAWIEARFKKHKATDDFDLMIFEVLDVYAPKDTLTKKFTIDINKCPTIHHLGGMDFCTIKKI